MIKDLKLTPLTKKQLMRFEIPEGVAPEEFKTEKQRLNWFSTPEGLSSLNTERTIPIEDKARRELKIVFQEKAYKDDSNPEHLERGLSAGYSSTYNYNIETGKKSSGSASNFKLGIAAMAKKVRTKNPGFNWEQGWEHLEETCKQGRITIDFKHEGKDCKYKIYFRNNRLAEKELRPRAQSPLAHFQSNTRRSAEKNEKKDSISKGTFSDYWYKHSKKVGLL